MDQLSLRERNRQRTRQRILSAAFELFKSAGYHQTTIDDIAQKSEVSRRTLFNYFPSKEALLLPWAQEILDGWVAPLDGSGEQQLATRFDVASLDAPQPPVASPTSITANDSLTRGSAHTRCCTGRPPGEMSVLCCPRVFGFSAVGPPVDAALS